MKQKNTQSNNVTKADIKILLDDLLERVDTIVDQKIKAHEVREQERHDAVMGELEIMRQENTIGTYQTSQLREEVDDHEKRIKKLEKSHHTP